MRWWYGLRQHPGWLLILDNIDSEEDAVAAETLLPQLAGGHALLTGRLGNWPICIAALPFDVLSPAAAADFLLARTAGKRRGQPDDLVVARTLAGELGHLLWPWSNPVPTLSIAVSASPAISRNGKTSGTKCCAGPNRASRSTPNP